MYIIISSKQAFLLIDKYQGKEISDFEKKTATFELNNGKYVIVPARNPGNKSLLFENKKDYDSFTVHPIFPITDTGYFFKYERYLKNISKSREVFYADMNKMLSSDFKKIETEGELKRLFDAINAKIKRVDLKNKNIDDEFQTNCFVLIGDYLHYAYDYRWASQIEYFNFQTYYTPHIVYFKKYRDGNDWEFLGLRSIIADMTKHRRFDYPLFKQEFDHSLRMLEVNFNNTDSGDGIIIPPFK